jgi:UDP-N-acetylglucosamine/UDP-N-acetylgalactosamine diphosphorylase
MAHPDQSNTLQRHEIEQMVAGWEHFCPTEHERLRQQIASIDFAEIARLSAKRNEPHNALPPRERIAPMPVEAFGTTAAVPIGEEALRNGEVAALLVAGGQGSRLGFDKPKGMFPVGPVSGASLFQIHAEKVLALGRRFGKPVPFLVMTSPATHAETIEYFEAQRYFGLSQQQVRFFQQGTMPALDLATGKLLLEKPGELFLSPNGHGGTLTALADSGLLGQLKADGVKHVFYFQVDNPLVQICDPGFVGRHIETNSEASSKVVFKEDPAEKVGIYAIVNGRCGIIEYSDMPKELNDERTPHGTLAFRAGSPAIHCFSLPFLERVTSGADRLAYHVARKKVPYYDAATRQTITPTTENALKFELFVFDALPLANRWLAVQTLREDEFAPLKNATGNDSLETVHRLMVGQAKRWLMAAGASVADGVPLEIAPTFALDAQELQAKLQPGVSVAVAKYFSDCG